MNIIITGASSGLGAEIKKALEGIAIVYNGLEIVDWSTPGVDIRDRSSIYRAKDRWAFSDGRKKLDILINCAGVNGIDYLPNVEEDAWDRIMDTNAKGIFQVSQALLPFLHGGTILNIVSNASHMPMTCSIAYNASKGAAAIMTRQMARELKKTHDITVFGISPNKLAGTGMSRQIEEDVQRTRGWTKEEAAAYQLASLPAGEETDPATLAEFIAFLLASKKRHKYLNGCILEYGI